jgi:hypothetical protein
VLEYLYNALNSRYGIILECDDRHALQKRLYKERDAAEDPELSVISLVFSPLNPRQLWLVKKQLDKEG